MLHSALYGIVLLGLALICGTVPCKIVILVSNGTHSDLLSRDWALFLAMDSRDIVIYRLRDTDHLGKDFEKLYGLHGTGPAAVVDVTEDCAFANVASEVFSPYIRAAFRTCRKDAVINIRPHLGFYAMALWNYTRQTKSLTARAVFLYDPIFGNEEVLIPAVLLSELPPIIVRVLESEHMSDWVTRLFARDSVHVVTIVGRQTTVNTFFQEACMLGIPNTIHWTVVLTDAFSFNWTLCTISPLTLIRHRKPSWNRPWTNTSEQVSITQAFLIKAVKAATTLLNSSAGSSRECVGSSLEDPSENVQNQETLGSISREPSQDTFPTTLDLLQVKYTDRGVIPIEVGHWQLETGIKWYNWSSPGGSRYKLTVVAKHEPPFVIRHDSESGTTYTGYAMDVFDEVARRLGVDYSVHEPADGQYGKMRMDGSWTGLVGDILTGYADIAVASLSVTTERDRVVDFTTPYYDFAGIQILIKSDVTSSSLLAFTSVFTQEVWACWAAVLLLTGVCVCVFERLSPYGNRKDGSQRRFSLKESMWLVAASLTMAGPESIPRTFSSRIMVGGFWFFCSITMATYTANLAAFLTTSRLNVPIESLDDLSKQSAMKYSVVRGTVMHEYFERMAHIESSLYQQWKTMSFDGKSIDPTTVLTPNYAVWDYPLGDTYMTIWKDIQRTGLINDSQEGLVKVLNEKFAFIHESPMVKYEVSRRCDLMAVGKQFSVRPYAFALPQGSPLTKIISYTILEMQSETILETLKTKWWGNNSTACSRVDESRGLTFHTVGGIFILVSCGCALGLLSLLLERVWASVNAGNKPSRTNSRTSPNCQSTSHAFDVDADLNYYNYDNENENKNTLEMARMY